MQACHQVLPGRWFLALLLWLVAMPAWAGLETLPEPATAQPGDRAILISAPFSGDDNGDNQLLIEWAVDGSAWSELLGSQTLDHVPSPFSQTLSGLDNSGTYQVRLTFSDVTGLGIGPNPQIFTGLIPFSPLIHSSRSTGSSRWLPENGWGIKGGKYGEFSCGTCHSRNTGNIKRIKTTIAVTDANSGDQLPLEKDAGQVFFSDARNGSADFGDDQRLPADSSSNICEACHTQTKFHNYDTANNTEGLSHFNRDDCTACHRHNQGFAVSCGSCHPNPPNWPSHGPHLSTTAPMSPVECDTCHQGATHINDRSEVRFGADSRVAAATYSDQGGDEASRYTVANGYLGVPAYGNCDNLYCHSNGFPFDAAAIYRTPTWGGPAQSCASCHDTGGTTTGLSGKHAAHTDLATYAYDCGRCHADTAVDGVIVDPVKHLNQTKDVAFSASGSFVDVDTACASTYCHSNAIGGAPNQPVTWADAGSIDCASCHDGLIGDPSEMVSNGHSRLASSLWIRQYRCSTCHNNTVDDLSAIKDFDKHVDETVEIAFPAKYTIEGLAPPSYDSATKTCLNLYCHSDGTSTTPEVREFPWDAGVTAACNSCHGHQGGDCAECHEAATSWSPEEQWKAAMPMYPSTNDRPNSHPRHLQTDFSCENCHAATVVGSCTTTNCHDGGVPSGTMSEVGHVDASKHVDTKKTIVFKDGGSYDPATKTCSSTACHGDSDPQWGQSINGEVVCLGCHGTAAADVDDFGGFNDIQARINIGEWETSGHGRPLAAGNYASGNPPADLGGNPCWYCHDSQVLHKETTNPFRLKKHNQFEARFDKECVYCHMEGTDSECLSCHNAPASLAPQLTKTFVPPLTVEHSGFADGLTSCTTTLCHPDDGTRHKTGAGLWSPAQKDDVKNQYVMMGVCLKCHDDDSNNRCNDCHNWTGAPEDNPYRLGYDVGFGHVSGISKATSTHFGYKHYAAFENNGTWKGGKFCWDCHDPHGDSNIYMIQDQVAITTDGTFGKPLTRGAVRFTKKESGLDYARINAPYDGICNVCHTEGGQHFRDDYGDGHNSARICTNCHEHRFSDSHASGADCSSCHQNKPIPRHSGFGLPRDCTKCHAGYIKKRADIMGQFGGKSHHIQGTEVTSKKCYACHWEATEFGLIDIEHHEGYNYQTHETVTGAKTDLVVWEPGKRPDLYQEGVTAETFTANKMATVEERAEVAKVSNHCLGCHSDKNNDTDPFNDCKTPRQYAWDGTSVGARYSQPGTTTFGKYSGNAKAARKNQQKAFSAHGNAINNQGGWDPATGEDGDLSNLNTRAGLQNVQCFDCHNSHGSYTEGVTSSYVTFDGTQNGANLKDSQAGKGGYQATYRAKTNTEGVNPLNPGGSQCFDCHETRASDNGTPADPTDDLPWGFESTFGAAEPIQGYRDSSRFAGGDNGVKNRWPYRSGRTGSGGHLKASSPLNHSPMKTIDGLCSPCHDPHGVSPTLGDKQAYGLPLLKGTWLTSPYKEDSPQTSFGTYTYTRANNIQVDRKVFGDGKNFSFIVEAEEDFAGLCLSCHPKEALLTGEEGSRPWKDSARVHEAVKGWGSNGEHAYSCSKCHQPHSSGPARLMRTNCLDTNHRNEVESGGTAYSNQRGRTATMYYKTYRFCHESPAAGGGAWDEQGWNTVTPW